MSLSRTIAQFKDSPEELSKIFQKVAREIYANPAYADYKNDRMRKIFKGAFRPEFRKLHQGGMPKQELSRLRNVSLQHFHRVRDELRRVEP